MFTMMMDVKAVDNLREVLMNSNTKIRRERKSIVNPFSFLSSARNYNGMDYCNVNGVLMPR